MVDDDRSFGVVKVFDELKGFGFIRRKKGKDVFAFYGDVDGNTRLLSPGDQVSFVVEMSPKGPRARNIKIEGAAE